MFCISENSILLSHNPDRRGWDVWVPLDRMTQVAHHMLITAVPEIAGEEIEDTMKRAAADARRYVAKVLNE